MKRNKLPTLNNFLGENGFKGSRKAYKCEDTQKKEEKGL